MDVYIKPNIIECKNIEEIKQENNFYWSNNSIEVNRISEYNKVFIFAEPGYGKTTLLNEIYNKAVEKNEEGIYIDLKKVSSMDYNTLLDKLLNISSEKIYDELEIKKTQKISNNSTLKQVICLDALDEVKATELDSIYESIQRIMEIFKNANIIISARINRSDKYFELTKKIKFRYLKILKFSKFQLNEYLDKNLNILELKASQKIKNNILAVDSDVVLIPRYLSYTLHLLKSNVELFENIVSRSELMEKVLLEKISSKDEEFEERMQLRVLGKLALAMEINQTKEITVDDFINFFELIDSKICERTYHRYDLKKIYNDTVLKYNNGMIGFENAEIQEYLAAREINFLNDSETRLYDIVTDNPAKVIFPYWTNTMSYYVEMNTGSLINILKYDYCTDVIFDSNSTKILHFVNLNKYTQQERFELGELIYSRYQKIGHWIPYNVYKQLGEMLSLDYMIKELRKNENSTSNLILVRLGNILKIILSNIESNKPLDNVCNELKKLVIHIIRNSKKSVIQRYSLNILKNIGDIKDIEKIYEHINLSDELIEREFVQICSEKYYNSDLAVKIFFDVFSKKQLEFNYAYLGVMKISKSKYFAAFLKEILVDEVAFEKLLNFNLQDYKIKNIKSSINRTSKNLLKLIEQAFEMIINTPDFCYKIKNSDFCGELIKLFDKKDKMNTFKYFIKYIEDKKYSRYHHEIFLVKILSDSNSKDILNYLYAVDHGSKALESFAKALYWDEQEKYVRHKSEIDKIIGREILIKTSVEKIDEKEKIYQKFKALLHVNNKQYDNNVFSFFNKNYEFLIDKVTNKEINDIRNLAKKIIKNIELKNVSINQGKVEDQYTITSTMIYFPHLVKTLYLLEEDISKYKIKIFSLIPYMESNSWLELEFLYDLIEKMSSTDIDNIIKIWSNIEDEAFKFHGVSVLKFLKILVDYKTDVLISNIFKFALKIYNDYKYKDYQIIEFINFFDACGVADDFLNKQLEIHAEEYNVVMCINSVLIRRGNKCAIEWRFKKIEKFAQKFTSPKDIHNVSAFEDEIGSLRMAEPIMSLSIEYEDLILKLADFSLSKYQEDEDFYDYANYLWKIVKGFYMNRIEDNPQLDLGKLHAFSNANIEVKGISLFLYTLNEIMEYKLKEHSKRIKFCESVLFLKKISSREKIIDNPKDFNRMLQQIIENDLRRWVEFEGAYKMMPNISEDLCQKTIKGQIELACVKYGFDVQVIREPQSLSDKRPDFILTYGFAGTQLIEIKRLKNEQVANKKKATDYMKKLQAYIEAFNADNIIYLVLKVNETSKKLGDKIKELEEMYSKDERIIVCGLDAFMGDEHS